MLNIIVSLIVGALAGAAASKLIQGKGMGLLGDTLVGVVGGFLGGILFGLLGFETSNIIGTFIVSFLGAALLLFGVRYFTKSQ